MGDCPTDDKLTKNCDYLTEHHILEDNTFPPKLGHVILQFLD